jgi:hypothetical protein
VTHLHSSRHQKGNMKNAPYRGPKNIRHHCTKCNHHGDVAPRICAPVIIVQIPECLTCFFMCLAVLTTCTTFHISCSKLQDIMRVISSKKCCINTCWIISFYTNMSNVMNIHGCNLKFYSKCFITPYTYNESCVSDNTTKERYPSNLNLLYMCSGMPQNKGTNSLYPTLCTSKDTYVLMCQIIP